jgi:hypothetical protein
LVEYLWGSGASLHPDVVLWFTTAKEVPNRATFVPYGLVGAIHTRNAPCPFIDLSFAQSIKSSRQRRRLPAHKGLFVPVSISRELDPLHLTPWHPRLLQLVSIDKRLEVAKFQSPHPFQRRQGPQQAGYISLRGLEAHFDLLRNSSFTLLVNAVTILHKRPKYRACISHAPKA